MTELLHKELTKQIIHAYYDVYNGTSRTYPEYIYENGMMHDLHALRIPCLRQDEYENQASRSPGPYLYDR